jgi:1,4-dihydroxy-2-naphthoate octaprenyltransferase
MQEPKQLLGPIRAPFLVLPPVCVLLGAGTAFWTEGEINILYLILAFVGAMAAHISVNSLNEYFDFRSGLDYRTRRTPFSGGSGTLPTNPQMARYALGIGLATLALAGLIGLYFLSVWGLGLLPLGLLGLFVIASYTSWITRYPLLCLIAPGLGFGTFMVMGTDFVLTGSYSWTAFVASLVPFFLVSNLLLLNQFPDVEADQSVGRRHFPILIGRQASSIIYNAFLLFTFLSTVAGVVFDLLPLTAFLGLLPLVIAVPTAIGAYRYADNMERLAPYLGLNVLLNILTPLLVAIGLFIGS